jgi:hypothetical protein
MKFFGGCIGGFGGGLSGDGCSWGGAVDGDTADTSDLFWRWISDGSVLVLACSWYGAVV